ncbi:lipopolysaccharide biosynthesis protein [Burkholderia oklahomensis]|uniref:lipopolysaccharide biosynthesis protein n=1 Tax=Burkholderia oklahomensis TaxID=342113 RepID=UPI000473BE3A|nr:oligosaccharide flippase family protein [Burkholderia oklahomensis]AJX31077.1 polysaccharide biosynthesis family protein [Burkholderia oklahomensis C6786]AOI47626.1 translocase [Burkholderia oklahomensis C6786]KUY65548.1 translocase [Burkholderia oklahomensis C6786]MBI0358940.1 oligosaccharide flippase family protein [Burkholderia oklahomensis]SUW57528.1 colanic acid exporter [Burkholderia oklahomensis]
MIRVRDSIVSLCGVVAGQIAIFGCISLIGRFQGPEALGHFNYLLALATFAGTLLACRYELACVSDSPADSFNAFVNVMALSIAIVALGCAAIFVAGRAELYVVAAYGFAVFVQLAAGGYLNSLRRYGWIAASRIAVNGSFLVCIAVTVLVPALGPIDAFGAYTAVTALVALLLLIAVALHGKRRGYSFAVTRAFFVEHSRFAKYILPSTLCGSVLTYALAIVIPHWFDAQSAGYFAAAYRLGFFPVSLIAQSLGGVFRRDAMAAMARDDAHTMVPKVFGAYARSLALLAAGYAAGGALLFGPLVELFFGARWSGAIAFFQCMIPLFALQMIYVPLSQIFLAARAQRIDFLFQLGSGAVLAGALCTAKLANLSVLASVRLFSFSGAVLMIAGIALTFSVMNGSVSRRRAGA